MQVKSRFLQYFRLSLSYHLLVKVSVLSTFEWRLKADFTVCYNYLTLPFVQSQQSIVIQIRLWNPFPLYVYTCALNLIKL